jgi:hypothetical protein
VDVDGLWMAKFSTPLGTGSGVAVFVNGQILGGDSNYYYSGSYHPHPQDGKLLVGTFRVVHFFGPLNNVFGPVREITLSFTGAVGDKLIMASAISTAHPGLNLAIRLERADYFRG